MARGSGTSLSGGSLPIREGIIIGLNRLNRVLELDPAERCAVVEPGVINLDLTALGAPHGLYYAPDPSSQSICTIGGNVAFNSGGAHCLRHGMTSNHVLGLKAVLPDGAVVELGSKSLEGVGPDLTGFFVGSEGLFGIALEITVRLIPKPESYKTILAAYRSLEAAGDAVTQVVATGLLPGAMEIMDHLAIKAAEAAVHAGYPQTATALLIVELEGEAAEVEAEFQLLEPVIRASGAFEIRVARDEGERLRIWKGRKSAFSAVGRLSPDFIVQDGVVPRKQLGSALAEIQALARKHGIRVANVFHAGDGNLHPLILFDGTEAGALEKAEELAGDILQMCIRRGGSITGEHGVGMEKREYLARMFAPTDMEVMKRLRRSIDPLEIANRRKMFPDENGHGRVPPPEIIRSGNGARDDPETRVVPGSAAGGRESRSHPPARRRYQAGSFPAARGGGLSGPERLVRHRGVRAGRVHLHGSGGHASGRCPGEIGARGGSTCPSIRCWSRQEPPSEGRWRPGPAVRDGIATAASATFSWESASSAAEPSWCEAAAAWSRTRPASIFPSSWSAAWEGWESWWK